MRRQTRRRDRRRAGLSRYTLGVKTQVKAQFGDSSNELQALGLKKKSEHKSPSKKNTP